MTRWIPGTCRCCNGWTGWRTATATYPKGWENDPWHPNDEGYKHYYEQIPQKVWDLLECPKP